jgi:hypothetical protein
MNYRLKKDIVVKAGTIFEPILGQVTKYVYSNYSHLFGLTNDSSGEIIYGIDPGDKEINDWFEEVK